MRSVLSYRLFTTTDTLGALNLFSRTPNGFDTEDIDDNAMPVKNSLVLTGGTESCRSQDQTTEVARAAMSLGDEPGGREDSREVESRVADHWAETAAGAWPAQFGD